MRKLSDETIGKIKELRKEGLTVREIGERLRLSPATVFYYARDITKGSEYEEQNRIKQAKIREAEVLTDVEGYEALSLYLPYTIICPHCGKEQDTIALYYDTGNLYCECGKKIDLRVAPRKEELFGK